MDMTEIFYLAVGILVYLIYNLFVPPQYKRPHYSQKTDLRSLFRDWFKNLWLCVVKTMYPDEIV